MTYQGVGYSDNVNTVGNQAAVPPASTGAIQNYLINPGTAMGTDYISLIAQTEVDEFNAQFPNAAKPAGYAQTALSNYYNYISAALGQPLTLSDLIAGFRNYLYSTLPPSQGGPTIPSNATYQQTKDLTDTWMSQANLPADTVETTLADQYAADMGLNTWTIKLPNGSQVLYSNAIAQQQQDFAFGLLSSNYADFMKDLAPTITTNLAQWKSGFQSYLREIVNVPMGSNPLSYEAFYNAYFGSVSGSDFNTYFANFVASQTANGGNFNPSVTFGAFTQQVLNDYASVSGNSGSLVTPTTEDGSTNTHILNTIFSLLVMVTESLQRVAAAQSNRLTLFSQWQSAYTDLQTGIKYFLQGDTSVNQNFIKSSNQDNINNTNSFNSGLTANVQARLSVVGDDAKNLQTQINQSNDDVNQQTSLATSILQQMATILQSLYH